MFISDSAFEEKVEAFRKERERKRAEAGRGETSEFTIIQKNKTDELLVTNKQGEVVYRRPPRKVDDDDFSLSDSDDDLQTFCASEKPVHLTNSALESDTHNQNPEDENDNIDIDRLQLQEDPNSNIVSQGSEKVQEEHSSGVSEPSDKPSDNSESGKSMQRSDNSLTLNGSEDSKVKIASVIKAKLGIPDSTSSSHIP